MENQQPQKPARNTMRGVLSHLKQMGLQPHTVIDVGAAAGTYELYETFPDAEHILIEPLQEFEEDLRNICATYNASYILAAADATVGTTTIYVHPEQLTGSSQLQQAEGKYADGFPRLVPSTTVDSVCKEKGVQGPFLLKADVREMSFKSSQEHRKYWSKQMPSS